MSLNKYTFQRRDKSRVLTSDEGVERTGKLAQCLLKHSMIRFPKPSPSPSDIVTRDAGQANEAIVEVNADDSLPLGQVLLLFLSSGDASPCTCSHFF